MQRMDAEQPQAATCKPQGALRPRLRPRPRCLRVGARPVACHAGSWPERRELPFQAARELERRKLKAQAAAWKRGGPGPGRWHRTGAGRSLALAAGSMARLRLSDSASPTVP